MSEEKEPIDLSSSRAAKKQHDKIVAWVNEQYRMIRDARSTVEQQWYLNLAFYYGKQHVQVLNQQSASGRSTKLYTPGAPPWRARPVINRIRPTIRTALSQLTNNKPNAMVIPASAEDRDMYAAMAGEQIWDNLYVEKKLKAVFRRAMWWNLVCGNGFIKTYWDPKKGTINEQTGAPVGDIVYCSESPFHVLVPDFIEEELESQPFMLHISTRSPEYVQMNFPNALDGSKVDHGTVEGTNVLEDSFLSLIGARSQKQHQVLVLEVYVKKDCHPMFPNGAFLTVINNKIVQGFEGMPYSHNLYPFAKFDHIPSGKFYHTSDIEDLIPLQKELNRTRGQIVEAKNRMAKPQLLAPRGSIDASKMTTEPGLVIEYTPGFAPPTPLPLQALPNYVIQEVDRILTDWNDISGQHEVSQGTVPAGVTAATAISFLQERDESKLSPTFDSLEEGIEKLAKMSLVYVHDYWDTEHLVKITGTAGSFDVLAFKGSDLQNNLDIRIEAGSALPVSKAAKQAFIMDLMNMGHIDPQKGLEVMDVGGINKIYEQIQVDQRQAQRENLRLSRVTPEMMQQYNDQNMQKLMQDPAAFDGQDPPLIIPVNTWDNHKVHIEYHDNYRKGQAFEAASPEVKALFEAHVQMHIMAISVEMETMPQPEGEAPEGEEEPEQPGPEPMPELETS